MFLRPSGGRGETAGAASLSSSARRKWAVRCQVVKYTFTLCWPNARGPTTQERFDPQALPTTCTIASASSVRSADSPALLTSSMGMPRAMRSASWNPSPFPRCIICRSQRTVVCDDHGLDRVLLVLAGDELSRSLCPAAGRRTRISVPSMMPVFPSVPRWSMTSARVRSRTPWLMVHPRSASKGRTSAMARVMVERSTPNQQAITWCVVACRRCTSVARSRSTNTNRCFAPAPSPLPRPGRKPGLVPVVPQRAKPSHKFSDHVGRQARDPPVAGDRCARRVPHHTTMINGQKLDASPPTVHELVRRCSCSDRRRNDPRRSSTRRPTTGVSGSTYVVDLPRTACEGPRSSRIAPRVQGTPAEDP